MTHMCVIHKGDDAHVRHQIVALYHMRYACTSCDTKKQSDDAHVRHHLYWMTHMCVIEFPHDAQGRHKFQKEVIITELSEIARGLGIELGTEGVKGIAPQLLP